MSALNLEPLKISFKEEFSKIMCEFNDFRNIKVLSIGDYGFFSEYFNLLKTDLGFGYLYADEENIEFYFDEKEMINNLLNSHPQYKYLNDEWFFKRVMRQIAAHEYGHLFLTPTFLDIFPNDIKKYFISMKVRNFRDLIELIKDQDVIHKVFSNHPFYKSFYSLHNIKIVDVINIIKEFHANYSAFSNIYYDPPNELMEMNLVGIAKLIEAFVNLKISGCLQQNISFLYDKIHRIIILSQLFFLYNDSDIIEDFFNNNEFKNLYDYILIINTKVETIVRKRSNLEDMMIDIIELANFMYNHNYLNMFC